LTGHHKGKTCEDIRVFENRVLGRIFGPTRDGVTVQLEELHNIYSSSIIVGVTKCMWMGLAECILRIEEMRSAYEILVYKREGKISLGRSRRRWEDNIKVYLKEIVYENMDWVQVAQDDVQWRTLANTVMNLRVP
jgi:hypothetical protein